MQLPTVDFVILAIALVSAVIGAFVGFSGALALLAGLGVSALVTPFVWSFSADLITGTPLRAIATLLASLLVFGLVRVIVRKLVRGMVAQPGDAILGALAAAVTGFALALFALWGAGQLLPESPLFKSVLLEKMQVNQERNAEI